MQLLKKGYDSNYFMWIEKDEYYKNDIWMIKEHRFYNNLTAKQKASIEGRGYIDFSLCKSENLKNELKNACACIIETKICKVHIMHHDKFVIDYVIKYFNEKSKYKDSILQFTEEEILDEFEKFLDDNGIVSRRVVKRVSANMKLKYYDERSKSANFVRRIYDVNRAASFHYMKEKEKDIWDIRKLDINVTGFNCARPRYTINFERILQPKIREVVKKYEYERLKTRKYSAIIDDLKVLNLFSKFLYEEYPEIDSLDKLTRDVVLEFLGYIEVQNMCSTTKGQRKGCLRVFLNLVVMYGWENTPKEKLLHKNDYGKKVTQLPKPISATVMQKLNENIKYLPKDIKRMVYVIQNIGMRVNELCQLKTKSVKKDAEGDYFIEYYQSKTDKYSRIPIKEEVAEVILVQEKEILLKFKDAKYIFTRDGEKPISQESFSYHINRLAYKHDIRDENGKLYRFKSHHFRHTVATRYVNNGMNPNMIRIMLGHSKMKSIMNYIELRDSTVIEVMEQVFEEQDKLISNLTGEMCIDPINEIDLVNGKCIKSIGAKLCEKAGKCYECSMFYFCNEDIDDFNNYLLKVNDNITYAEENGFDRMAEINRNIKNNIEKLITS